MLSKKTLLMMASAALIVAPLASAAGRGASRHGGGGRAGGGQAVTSCVVATGELVASSDPLGFDGVLVLSNVCGDRVLLEGSADLFVRYSSGAKLLLGRDDDLSDGARFQVAPSSVPLLGALEICLSATGSAQALDGDGDPLGDALPFDEERCLAAPGSLSIRDISLR